MTPLPQFGGGVERDWTAGLSVLGLQFCIANRLCRVTTATLAFGLIHNQH